MKNSSQQQTNIDKTERTNIFTPFKKSHSEKMTAMRQTWPTSFKNVTNIVTTEVCLKVYQSQMNKDKLWSIDKVVKKYKFHERGRKTGAH